MGFLEFFVLLAAATGPGKHWYLKKKEHRHRVKWGYSDDIGPAHWGDLSPAYKPAKNGRKQSPIDIDTGKTVPANLPEPRFHYVDEKAVFLNNGHTLEHEEGKGNWLEWNGKRYRLAQFHFHTPSEHTVDGRHAPMEIHLVHRGMHGEALVVGIMVNRGAPNEALVDAARHLPHHTNEKATVAPRVNASDFLPRDRGYYLYDGSFTTPPRTEGVTWLVMKQRISAPAAMISEFRKTMEHNNRPVQPLNGRTVQI